MQLTVIQTAAADRPGWINSCLQSVRDWAMSNQFDYRFAEDNIKSLVDETIWQQTENAPQAGFDVLRLVWMQEVLRPSHTTHHDGNIRYCMWLDADTLVIDGQRLTDHLPWGSPFAVGRENWLHREGSRVRVRRHVHNAALWANSENPVLPFYEFAARKILERIQPPFVPQLIGPKLLTSWHNVIGFDVMECCTMVSPDLVTAIETTDRPALAMYSRACEYGVAAVNLCTSLAEDDGKMAMLVAELLENAQQLFGE